MKRRTMFRLSLYGPITAYSRENYVPTPTGNRISPVGHKIIGLSQIMVFGKTIVEPNVTMRGDIAKINVGSFCIICENSVLKPAEQLSESNSIFMPVVIGNYVVIGRSCTIRASHIGSYVYVGEACVVGSRCILESCSMLEPNTVLAPGTVVPPFCVFGGNPGKKVGQLAPSFQFLMETHCKTYYSKFMSERKAKEHRAKKEENAKKRKEKIAKAIDGPGDLKFSAQEEKELLQENRG